MASVRLANVSKSFGRVEVVHGVSLEVPDRELTVFVGPSGCGKSTLLRMIAGLETIGAGTLHIGDRLMNEVPAADRGIAMVFQSYALYPHMTVAENMGFALKMSGVGKAEVEEKVRAAAAILRLEGLLERKPRQLSGGQRQRVAIGRAITRSPAVFLFDEPLSNLDADLRAQMRVELARLHEELQTTMIYVTHDQVEAMTLAERIVVLNNGVVEQVGAPLDLYEHPANRFVAGFLGQPKMNFVPAIGRKVGDEIAFRLPADGPVVASRAAGDVPPPGPVELGIRPDAISLVSGDGLPARLALVERLGGTSLLHVSVAGLDHLLTVQCPGTYQGGPGETLQLRIDPSRLQVFDAAGHALL